MRRSSRRSTGTLAAVVVIWLIIGAVATAQRGYFKSSDPNCARTGKITVTVLAGPLNYMGVNPKTKCLIPQPSK